MQEQDWLAESFEDHRAHLRAVAYRMLGSVNEADDAVQEAWLRLSRSDTSDVDNLPAWLTTVVARVCLNMLRSRRSRREEPFGEAMPDPVVSREDESDPEYEALLADSVGLALLVVLETLTPAERLAFVLHDMFAVPFDEIAPIVDRSPGAARQLAKPRPPPSTGSPQRRTPTSAASERWSTPSRPPHATVTSRHWSPSLTRTSCSEPTRPCLPDSRCWSAVRAPWPSGRGRSGDLPSSRPRRSSTERRGPVVAPRGQPFAVMAFTVVRGKIVEIEAFTDPERLRRLDLSFLES